MTRGREKDGDKWAGSSGRNDAGCSKSKSDDHVSVDVLDMLDLESDPPSSDEDEMSWKAIDCGTDCSASNPVLEAKHQIFLSHSGQQKDFTELLCRELERWGYSPFFDIREDSLPKGKKFPELIFRAARECRVAVLILSEAFFTNTKWPMLELAAFVDAQEKSRKEKRPAVDILPVYLGLTREECRKDENVERWQKRWEEMESLEMAEKMKEMDELGRAEMQVECEALREGELRSQKWKDALKVLGPSNGIEYEKSSRQAGLIDRVVSAVRGLLRPPSMASDPGTQARGRICSTLIEMISKTRASSNGARVVGVYGMGGMGKTTFCKELCCELYKRFEGKVCHAEMGRLSGSELQKRVVQKLTDVNHHSLSSADDSKVIDYVKNGMAGEKVFLALDDVWPESKGEAMVYVEQARYGKGSIVMVTARSMDVLLSLRIRRSNCFEMPELEVEDARRLFLHHAAPDFHSQCGEDEKCIRRCLHECRFTRVGKSGGQFLPLALKVLGEQMQSMGENPRIWVESLSKEGKFDVDRKKDHPIFFILGRGYDLLQADDQLLFMDVVICSPQWWPRRPLWLKQTLHTPFMLSLYEWLSIVHYGTTSKVSSIKDRLQGLKARAFLEDIGDCRGGVAVHGLYREFAKFEASGGDLNKRRVLWHTKLTELPTDLVKRPSGNCWSQVERVGINCLYRCEPCLEMVLGGVSWQHFANVVVLEIQIGGDNQVLDLQGLQCLRSLTVRVWSCTVVGLGKMRNLRWLDLLGVFCGPVLGEIGCLSKLQMVRIEGNCSSNPEFEDVHFDNGFAGGQLSMEKCINLQHLEVMCYCLEELPHLGGLKLLRKVCFMCPRATRGLEGLGSQLPALQELTLSTSVHHRFPCLDGEVSLQGLDEVVSLQQLDVSGLPELEVFPDICMLTRLRSLDFRNMPKLALIPGLEELVSLESLGFWSLPKLRELSNMRLLTKLQSIWFGDVCELWEQPQLLSMIPSQLRFFSTTSSQWSDSECMLTVTYNGFDNSVDLHEWYKQMSATVLRDMDPGYPSWGVAQI